MYFVKQGWLFILTAALLSSCRGGFVPPQEQAPRSPRHSYCSLLHISSKPYPAITPKPYLGIFMAPRKLEQSLDSCKESAFVQVAGIIDRTPGAEAGLREDDVILALNGITLCGDEDRIIGLFKKTIERQRIGQSVTLDVLRGDKKIALTALLRPMPTHDQQEAGHPEMERCGAGESLLMKTLSGREAVPLFKQILAGLYERSNMVHNPGMPDEKEPDPRQLREVTYLMRQPLAAGEVARELSGQFTAPLEETNWSLHGLLYRSASILDLSLSSPEAPAEAGFPALLHAVEKTRAEVDESLAGLSEAEKTLLRTKAFDPMDDAEWNQVLETSRKVDRARLVSAFSSLFAFFSRDNLSRLRDDLVRRFGQDHEGILYEAETAAGKVIVGGSGPDTYRQDAALILDLGGDDWYLNNAGGTRPGMPLAVVIDWEGNDQYLSRENFSQGAGLLGGGMLIDLGGNDTFTALDGSQGAGFWGLGLLYHGGGTGTFVARKACQGTGQMGIGLLASDGGNSRYLCSSEGQGLGLFGGAGILLGGPGQDFYQLGGLEPDFRDPEKATQSFGQGFGFGKRAEKGKRGVPGGMGMLIDRAGDDVYLADYFSQGASYYYGLGILDDRAGDDRYLSGRYSQGAGIHSAVGVLIDRRGNDRYYSSFGVAQGMGHDFGVGLLDDGEGSDLYRGGILVQGAATQGSLGMLLDLSGADARSNESRGGAYADDETGMGIVLGKGRSTDAPIISIGVRKE